MRFVFLYMIGMLVFGTTNTIILKLTDMTESRGSDFEHPYFQSAVMFLGESLYSKLSSNFHVLPSN